MKTSITLLFYFSFLAMSFGQNEKIINIIDQASKASIPYAIISNLEKTMGGYEDEKGIFDFNSSDIINEDSISIFAIGYVDTIIAIKELRNRDSVFLLRSETELSEIVVVSTELSKEKRKEYTIGVIQKNNDSGICQNELSLGSEYAIKMVKQNKNDVLGHIHIYFDKSGVRNESFRIKIYNDVIDKPRSLLHAVIIKPEKKLKKWTAIKLTKQDITLGESVFHIAYEPLITDYQKKYKHPSGSCYGQNIGTTFQQIEFYLKTSLTSPWWHGREILRAVPMIKASMISGSNNN